MQSVLCGYSIYDSTTIQCTQKWNRILCLLEYFKMSCSIQLLLMLLFLLCFVYIQRRVEHTHTHTHTLTELQSFHFHFYYCLFTDGFTAHTFFSHSLPLALHFPLQMFNAAYNIDRIFQVLWDRHLCVVHGLIEGRNSEMANIIWCACCLLLLLHV